MAERTLYYLADWTDETMPCGPTLQDWADWLAKPDEDWDREKAAAHGQVFEGFTLVELDQLECRFEGGAWRHPPIPEGADQFFLMHANGVGWDGETHSGDILECLANAGEFVPHPDQRPDAVGIFGQLVPQEGQVEHVACVKDGESILVRYAVTPEGPRCELVGQAEQG